MFLPAAGSRSVEWLIGAGSWGRYWSRTLDSSRNYQACCLSFYSRGVYWDGFAVRYNGYAVRAVRVSQN